jgi:predicted Rossmann-fold nucleotide-binding protein
VDFDHLVDSGMISDEDRHLFHYAETADEAWAHLAAHYGFPVP